MVEHLYNLIVPSVQQFHVLGYWIGFVAALLEAAPIFGMIVPGSITILLLAALAGRGAMAVGHLLLFSVAGALLGDNFGYYVGKRFYYLFKEENRILNKKNLDRAHKFIGDHGGKSVFLARFLPGLRENVPVVAGIGGMRPSRFFLWNLAGAVLWGLEHVSIGFFLGKSLKLAEVWLSRLGFVVVGLVVVLLLFYAVRVYVIRYGKVLFYLLSSIWQAVREAVFSSQGVQDFLKRHDKLAVFLKNRVDRHQFSGMPLTIISLAFIYVLFLFGGIVEDILLSEVIVSVDVRVANLLSIFKNKGLTAFFFWITLLGKWQLVADFVLFTLALLWVWRKREYIVPMLLTIAGSEIFVQLGKFAFHRARPAAAIYAERSFAFPSGHATIAVAFYGFVAYLLIRNNEKWKRKVNIFFFWLIVILAIGFSRLYLGVHYVSDVWGGYLVGALWLLAGIAASEYFCARRKSEQALPPRIKAISLALVSFSLLFYTGYAIKYKPPLIYLQSMPQEIKVLQAKDIFAREQLKYTETIMGERQEPLSFIIIANSEQALVDALRRSGWLLADEPSLSSLGEMIKAVLLKRSYSAAPLVPSFWNAQVHNFGFEKSAQTDKVWKRHEARFWRTNYVTEQRNHIYVGTAGLESGIEWVVIPKISPNIDAERELLFQDLRRSGSMLSYQKMQFVEPQIGRNFIGDQFFTDGKAYITSLQ
jgi:membrane protein DedA with SNARE-associated domain/membrane-associated phospholipid phosphatase